jgi:hypothetical protein
MANKETYNETDQGSLEGFTPVARSQGDGRWKMPANPVHENRVAAATELLADVLTGRAPSYLLKEAIAPSWAGQSDMVIRTNYPELYSLTEAYSTSDFPYLMGDVLDRMMLANFQGLGHDWRSYCRVSRPLRDFRTVRRLALNGAEGQYTEIVEGEEVTYTNTLAEDNYTYTPTLYGKGVKLTFRAIMNDDLSAFDSIPERLGKGGRRTVEKFVTELFFDSNGPDATFFASGNGNILTAPATNADLAIDALGAAFAQLLGFTDVDSEPILVEGVTLVYGPALHVTANNLINQLTVDVVEKGGISNQTIRVNNWIVRNITLVMNPYIPIVCTTNGATTWALFANPSAGRPAGEVGFLAGFEEPVLYRKASNSMRISGGLDQAAGDFATMDQHYKGILGMGGVVLEPQSAIGSNGSNA